MLIKYTSLMIIGGVTILLCVPVYYATRNPKAEAVRKQEEKVVDVNPLLDELNVTLQDPQAAMLSSTEAYVNDSNAYKAIVEKGMDAVEPLFTYLKESGGNGLQEHVLATAITDIAKSNNIVLEWSTVEEFKNVYQKQLEPILTK